MNKSLLKFQKILSEGIFVAGLALIFTMFLAVGFVKWQQLPNLAEILPADTEAFIILDRAAYPQIADRIVLPITELDWVGDHVGLATIDGDLVTIIELSSKHRAKEFMSGLRINNYIFKRDFLILAASAALDDIENADHKLESTQGYQNARGRLPYFSDAYAYIDLQSARQELISFFGNFGISEPGYLESILQIFPAFGAAIDFTPDKWKIESFTAIDKSRINGEGYFRHHAKYKQELVRWSSGNHAFEWGGHDLAAQLTRTNELLTELNPSAALVFNSSTNEAVRKIFGDDFSFDQVANLLDGEYYFGWTPDDNFLLMLGLDDEEDKQEADNLKDTFAGNYKYVKTTTLANGEVRGELRDLQGSSAKYEGTQYFRFEVDSQFVLGLAILDNVALVSTSEEEFFAALDKIQARQNSRTIHGTGLDANGADEVFVLNLDILSEGNILKTLLSSFSEIQVTRKIFDDGITARSSLLLSPTLSPPSLNDDQP